jgi:hypothetical protein
MSIASKIGSAIGTGLKEIGSTIPPSVSGIIRNNPQGLGLLGYGGSRISRGESGFSAYKTPLKLLGAGGALTLGAGAYSGATNTEDRDNALIGGLKGMLNSFSNFSENVLMPASVGVGVLAATGFTRKFETGYMLTRKGGAARDSYEAYSKGKAAGATGKDLDELESAVGSSLFPRGKPLKGNFPGVDDKNAVDRTNALIGERGFDIFTSRTAPSEMISELIEKDAKGTSGVLNTIIQGGSSMGYAVGGFMGEMDMAMGQAYKAFRAGKNAGKTPYEIKKEKETAKAAKKSAEEAFKKRTPEQIKLDEIDAQLAKQRRKESGNAGADFVSGLAKIGAGVSVIGAATYAGASAGNTGYFGGSPINMMSKGLSLRPTDADFIYSQEQQKMGQYEMVAAYNPSQVGMRDTDDAYSYAKSANPSSVNPMSPGLAKTSGRQRNIAPGQFGDTGSLVFAMNTLRRG